MSDPRLSIAVAIMEGRAGLHGGVGLFHHERGMARGQDVLSASTLQLCLRVVRKTLTLVDLRDLHTVPRTMLEGLRDQGKLVCRLVTPYREHLSQHFSVTYSRIGLPESYGTAD